MKLDHFSKCGTSLLDIPHPNQQRYVTQAAAGQSLPEDVRAAAAEMGRAAPAPADAGPGCSDHRAATYSGRLSKAVSSPLPGFSAACDMDGVRLDGGPVGERERVV